MGRYTNPVWQGYFADPFVLAADGGYHAFGTGGGDTAQALVGLRSPDLVHWEPAGTVLEPDDVPGGATHLWAPEVTAVPDGFALYYSAGVSDVGHALRLATSTDAGGPYRDVGPVATPGEPFAIDPHPFVDDDGSRYLFYAVDRLDGARVGTAVVVDRLLSPDRLAGDPRPVVTPSADWQLFLPGRRMYGAVHDWHTCEGPFVVRRRGRYWCLYSGGNWQQPSYGVSVAQAQHPLGPWTEETGTVPRVIRSVPGAVHGPGHASVVTDRAGVDWLVYHAWDPAGTARRMHLDRLRWTDRGPVCDGPTLDPQPAPDTG